MMYLGSAKIEMFLKYRIFAISFTQTFNAKCKRRFVEVYNIFLRLILETLQKITKAPFVVSVTNMRYRSERK